MFQRCAVTLLFLVALVGCQAWDRLEPTDPGGNVASTRVDSDEPSDLTTEVAQQRYAEIVAVTGAERVALIKAFFEDLPAARLVAELHRMAGESYLAQENNIDAAGAFERAMVLSGTDIIGLPVDVELAYQLGWARYLAGEVEDGTRMLVRVSIADRSARLIETLRWVHIDRGGGAGGFDAWLDAMLVEEAAVAPDFELPGYQQEQVRLADVRRVATLVNFWAPT